VCDIRRLHRADVVAGTAIDHTATALVSALVHARLVDVSALTGASDNHLVCWGIEIVYLETLNPFSGFNMGQTYCLYLYKLCYNIDNGH
jgi:hypothetical protein